MKITYAQNPLCSTIELSDTEKKEFWYKLKIEELLQNMSQADFTFSHNEWFNKAIRPRSIEETIAEARKHLDYEYHYGPDDGSKSKLDTRIDLLHTVYLEELMSSHAGDCVCFACSCEKCRAEGMLGIDTIKGLGKHQGNWVFSQFRDKETLAEVIADLEVQIKTPIVKTEKNTVETIERWTRERISTLSWLKEYQSKAGTVEERPIKL